ncbi:phosphatidylglycerophosphatase A family protein [Halomonas nitroreducens]|uniref:Phosphatidylglycerophosphatase A n=1 Tax=Halomonas nitroreducens TaxID=447425 RepID=A0A3S0HT16_9GAMM|nr:phosphatidylglycerophosphatase A [Halomonas nitroreducens]RTR02935.1 phosphatidylglycerophosphatase A [Halomonas nitroreducens]
MEMTLMWLATGLGLGLAPLAAGTFGSLLGLPLAWWLLGRARRAQLALAAGLLVAAMPLCHQAAVVLGFKDDGRIVLDEIVAYPLAVLGLSAARHPAALLGAFVVYRGFDIIKPLPVALAEALPGGVGIVLDDSVAAAMAWLVVAGGLALWRRPQPG